MSSATKCKVDGCPNESRMALLTSRPARAILYTKVWYDNRDEKIPKKALHYCRGHGLQTLQELTKILTHEDEVYSTDTQKKGT